MIHPTDSIRGKYVEAFERRLLDEIHVARLGQLRNETAKGNRKAAGQEQSQAFERVTLVSASVATNAG